MVIDDGKVESSILLKDKWTLIKFSIVLIWSWPLSIKISVLFLTPFQTIPRKEYFVVEYGMVNCYNFYRVNIYQPSILIYGMYLSTKLSSKIQVNRKSNGTLFYYVYIFSECDKDMTSHYLQLG